MSLTKTISQYFLEVSNLEKAIRVIAGSKDTEFTKDEIVEFAKEELVKFQSAIKSVGRL